jgi:hypothetical protein
MHLRHALDGLYRVLLNGSPRSHVANRHGLRQGDPLFPRLFILIMEVLHFMLEIATQKGQLAPLADTGLRQRTSIYHTMWLPFSSHE